jgi:hypothetical protein
MGYAIGHTGQYKPKMAAKSTRSPLRTPNLAQRVATQFGFSYLVIAPLALLWFYYCSWLLSYDKCAYTLTLSSLLRYELRPDVCPWNPSSELARLGCISTILDLRIFTQCEGTSLELNPGVRSISPSKCHDPFSVYTFLVYLFSFLFSCSSLLSLYGLFSTRKTIGRLPISGNVIRLLLVHFRHRLFLLLVKRFYTSRLPNLS